MPIKLVIIFEFNIVKRLIYIITDNNRSTLHVGMSSNLLSTMDFYKTMPTISFDNNKKLNKLVYFEEFVFEETARKRFDSVSSFTRAQKEKLIREVNANWIDLTVGLELEAVLTNEVTPETRTIKKAA